MLPAAPLTASQERWTAGFHAHCAELRYAVDRLYRYLVEHGDEEALKRFLEVNSHLIDDRLWIRQGLRAAGYPVPDDVL